MKKVVSDWKWVGVVGGIVALLVGLSSLGVVMPWAAASKGYVDDRVGEVEKEGDRNRRRTERLSEDLSRIEGKLDIVIQLLDKE